MSGDEPGGALAHAPFIAISAKAFEHPADRAATAALHRIPFFDTLVKKLLELTLERRLMQILLGNSVRLGERQLPEIWSEHRAAYTVLDVAQVPALHVIQWPFANAVTLGANRPTVLLQSSIVGMVGRAQLSAVLAHEAGHVLAEHVRYRTTLEILLRFTPSRLPMLGRLPVQAITMALLAWHRASELSCDRASALVMRDPLVVCRVLMNIAGGGPGDLNLDAFIAQADEYVEWDDLFDRYQRLGFELGSTHPFPVRRVHELTQWVKSGEYDRILAGKYVRRGEEPPMTAEFRAAVDHYTLRFQEFLERTAGGVRQMSRRVRRWLESLEGTSEDDADGD
ncbi:MAG: M48 family metallopeptidase [Candidatus Dormibacteraeota bacterium]|nr:M48 family metallopeptidase [Candidatus Dormibacteraeota bacterium]MBV9526503.1 M48 family metallopeptidase [Candidatus Dormibacteraeota bacterium]